MSKLCIYHKNCADGFTAAWVVRKALGEIEFHGATYETSPKIPDVAGKDVIMVDYSYKRPLLEQLRDQAASVTILDHHKTAEADLKDLPGVTTVFDMNRSGCGITWDYYFPKQQAPQLLLHVQDRDLWRYALRHTREIQAAVFAYPYDFKAWDFLMEQADLEQLTKEGEALERKFFKDLREMLPLVTRRMNIAGYNVPCANIPYLYASEAGNIMAQDEPFSASYYDTVDGRNFSLRSAETGIDVSQIALQFGGGGHFHAAGFRVSYEKAREFEIVA